MKHEEIIKSLSNIDINDQMKELRSLCMLDSDDIHQREKVCKLIENLLKEPHPEYDKTPDYTVHPYGSSVNGLGFKGCDIDAYVGTENDRDLDPKVHNMLTWKIRMEILHRLQYQKDGKEKLDGIENIPNARVPIIKFLHSKSGIHCDLSFSNRRALMNSRFIKMCLEVDSRIPLVMTVIKYWAMHHNLSGSGDRRVMLSNYALSLQVIFYLQSESILPSVKRLQQKMDEKDRTAIQIEGKAIEHGFPSDIEKWSREEMDMPINSKTLIQLLHGFFRFYATFDYLNFAISPNSGQMKLRKSKNLLCIEDPFDTNWDVSKVYKNDLWKRCCIFTEKVIANWLVNQNRANLLDIFAPIPKSEHIESLVPHKAKSRRTIYAEKKKEEKKRRKEKKEKETDVVLNTKILNAKFKSLSIKDQIKPTASTTGHVGVHEIQTQAPSILTNESAEAKSELSDNGYASGPSEPEVNLKHLPLRIFAVTDARSSLLKGLGLNPDLKTSLRPRDASGDEADVSDQTE